MALTKETTALYAGSFDPPTYGHLNIIERAAKIFPKLIVAIGSSADKKPILTCEERMELLRGICSGLQNVSIESYNGLTANFAMHQGASVLVRGVRNSNDWSYELAGATMNQKLVEDLETIIIPANQSYCHISSSLVRELTSHGGDISSLVPPLVRQKITDKFT